MILYAFLLRLVKGFLVGGIVVAITAGLGWAGAPPRSGGFAFSTGGG
jgi:hypothetical protein